MDSILHSRVAEKRVGERNTTGSGVERDRGEGLLFNADTQGSFSDKVMCEQRPEGRAGGNHSGIFESLS